MALMKFREPNQVKWRGVKPAHNGTQVLVAGDANNVENIFYTVPAGKIYYLHGFSLQCTPNITAGSYLAVYNTTPALWLRLAYLDGFLGTQVPIFSSSFSYPLEIPSLYTFRIKSNVAGFWARTTIFGWLE